MINSNNKTRRAFLRDLTIGGGALLLLPGKANKLLGDSDSMSFIPSNIYVARNGSVYQNVEKVVELMGGISSIVDIHDIVVLKPNCQWWNQGTTNVSAVRKFIELILDMPGFDGEIIIAENHQKDPPDSRGWVYQHVINGDPDAINLNELIQLFHARGYPNVTKYHWISGDKQGGNIVTGPEFGDGYVRTDIRYAYDGKETIMTYPIFTSVYSGIRIDLKNGAWADGSYIDRPVKLINFAGLNYHWLGVTSSVKNHLGIVELPGNDWGSFPDGSYNFHSIGTEGMGGAVGTFLQTMRRPDLNIATAEWVGWGSRTDTSMAVQAKTILASTDPVALDYWGSKHILYPLAPDNYERKCYLNPDQMDRPFYRYLNECHQQGIGTMNEEEMIVEIFDFQTSTNVSDGNHIPTDFISVGQNYPNPFNTSTTIPFTLNKNASVTVRMFNSLGQIVKTLIEDRILHAGNHHVKMDGMNFQKQAITSGHYIVEFIVNHSSCYRKIVYVK